MDFTKITCISESCKDKNIVMNGAGGCFGGRVSYAKVRCPECGLHLMIMPIRNEYEYSISAKTDDEIKDEQIKKLKEESELELSRKINSIARSSRGTH